MVPARDAANTWRLYLALRAHVARLDCSLCKREGGVGGRVPSRSRRKPLISESVSEKVLPSCTRSIRPPHWSVGAPTRMSYRCSTTCASPPTAGRVPGGRFDENFRPGVRGDDNLSTALRKAARPRSARIYTGTEPGKAYADQRRDDRLVSVSEGCQQRLSGTRLTNKGRKKLARGCSDLSWALGEACGRPSLEVSRYTKRPT